MAPSAFRTEPVPAGALLIDTDTKISAQLARMIMAATDTVGRPLGIRGITRYVYFGDRIVGDLDALEVQNILGARLGLTVVQHCRAPGWGPTGALGMADGQFAVANAARASVIAATSLALDLEGVAAAAAAGDVIAYCNNWYRVVAGAGFYPELYVGDSCGLSALQLYNDLAFELYWASLSEGVPDPLPRGFARRQIFTGSAQGYDLDLGGIVIPVDFNIVGRDRRGNAPRWMVAA